MMRTILLSLLLLSVVMISVGGSLDLTNRHDYFGITRDHAWNDGIYIVLLVIALSLLFVR